MVIWQRILDFTLGFIRTISTFADFLFTPLSISSTSLPNFSLVGLVLKAFNWEFTFTPIEILSIGGFTTIVVLWLIALINPLS